MKLTYPIRRDDSLIYDETENYPTGFGVQINWNSYPKNFNKIHAGFKLSFRADKEIL